MNAAAGDSAGSAWAGPLGGLKVLDLTRVLAGPFLTQMLGDLGAEILKIEAPGGGDETRTFAPHVNGESHYFMGLNRHKKSLVIDLKAPEGVDLVRRLAAQADVLVENFRPGVMDRLGLGYAALSAANPRLVFCSISGFGMTGPFRDKPSFDIVTQAMSGALSLNGEPGRAPIKLGLPLGDMVGGIYGSVGVLSALHERAGTGRGRLVDISLHDGMLGMLGYLAQIFFVTGKDPKPVGSGHPNIAPYGAFPASDGLIIIACLIQGFWSRLCEALECPQLADDPRFATGKDRLANRDALNETLSAITRTRTVADWEQRLAAKDVPHAPILGVGAALNHPHSLARDMVVSAEHPAAGTVRMVGRPIKFPGMTQAPLKASPLLGQHTVEVLKEQLGLDDAMIGQLRDEGVIDRLTAAAEATA
jgi:crotonobetainyl-CoA:carnitine CoA-transferase CaiB-like acyl-CoA transferase